MISTSGIFSTGLKKWMPMKFSCFFTPLARPVIGSVEVLEPSTASGLTTSSTSWNTLCLSSVFSNTASTMKSTPSRSAGSAVGVMRARISSFFSLLILPLDTSLSSSLAEYALPFSAFSVEISLSTTWAPERAVT